MPIVVTTNARSITTKIEYVSQFLDDLKPHVVIITETWLNASNKATTLAELRELCNTNYCVINTERPDLHAHGGGTLILVRHDFSYQLTTISPKPLEQPAWVTADCIEKLGKLELTIARIRPPRLPFNFSCCLLICVYIPEWSDKKQRSAIWQLTHIVEDAVTACINNNRPLIYINGDFNGSNASPLVLDMLLDRCLPL